MQEAASRLARARPRDAMITKDTNIASLTVGQLRTILREERKPPMMTVPEVMHHYRIATAKTVHRRAEKRGIPKRTPQGKKHPEDGTTPVRYNRSEWERGRALSDAKVAGRVRRWESLAA